MFCVIFKNQVCINSGSGYDDPIYHTANEVLEFETEDALKEWVLENSYKTYGKVNNYRIFSMTPVSVKTTVSINVEK